MFGDSYLHTFSISDFSNKSGDLGSGFIDITRKNLPMTENTLRESLSLSTSSKESSESERFSHRQIALKNSHGGSGNLFFFNNLTSSFTQTVIDISHNILRSRDFGIEDRFLKSGGSRHFTSIIASSGSLNNLTTSSVNGISMESSIQDIESDSSQVFTTHTSFFGSPLEGIFH